MNNLQSPQILSDLYRDLRDRRLLPLVVVLVVGMAIVPIVLSSSPEAAPPAPLAAPVAQKSNAPSETIVLANPGLRNYKKRLAGDPRKDPFIQQFLPSNDGPTASAQSTDGSGGAGAPSAGTDTSTSTVTSTGSTTPSSGGGTPSSNGNQPQDKYFSYRVKVRSGPLDGTPLTVHDSVGFLSPLPSSAVPAMQLLGVKVDSNLNAKTAVFLVSPAVSSVSGEGKCTAAGTACQTLYLKPGEHEDFVWSDGLTYRLELVKFNLISRNGLPGTGKDKAGNGGKNGRDGSAQRFAGSYFSF